METKPEHNTPECAARVSTTLIGMLGRPGCGKGTQCRWLAQTFAIEQISIGEVLRAEMDREGSQYAATIRENMLAGTVGPKEVTIPLLKSHVVAASAAGAKVLVLDGFPRTLDQLESFEDVVGRLDFVILLDCSADMIFDRLLPRGRFDDNVDNIRRRLLTFDTTTAKVIHEFTVQGRIKIVDAARPVERVSDQLASIFDSLDAARREHSAPGCSKTPVEVCSVASPEIMGRDDGGVNED